MGQKQNILGAAGTIRRAAGCSYVVTVLTSALVQMHVAKCQTWAAAQVVKPSAASFLWLGVEGDYPQASDLSRSFTLHFRKIRLAPEAPIDCHRRT